MRRVVRRSRSLLSTVIARLDRTIQQPPDSAWREGLETPMAQGLPDCPVKPGNDSDLVAV
jgi:hypothetical protein